MIHSFRPFQFVRTFLSDILSPKNRVFTLFTVSIGIILVVSSILFTKYKNSQNTIGNPDLYLKNQAIDLAKKVNRHIELPENEVPTLTTVIDKERLKDQPFFVNAQNGDKVLIYPLAKRAYLYRPSKDKLIEVSSFSVSTDAAKSQ